MFFDQISFSLELTNKTDKDIEGVRGHITFMDIFGSHIRDSSLSYDQGIKSGETVVYQVGVEYNQFISSHVKLRQTDLDKLKYQWEVDTIIYTDGTTETF
jgi:hypothetical protein